MLKSYASVVLLGDAECRMWAVCSLQAGNGQLLHVQVLDCSDLVEAGYPKKLLIEGGREILRVRVNGMFGVEDVYIAGFADTPTLTVSPEMRAFVRKSC